MSECAGKVRHFDRGSAKRARRSLRAHGDSGRLNVYQCAHCGFFHIGHGSAGLVRRIRTFQRYAEGAAE